MKKYSDIDKLLIKSNDILDMLFNNKNKTMKFQTLIAGTFQLMAINGSIPSRRMVGSIGISCPRVFQCFSDIENSTHNPQATEISIFSV